MYSRLFTGLFLVTLHFSRCDCAPGRKFPLLDFPIDVSLEELEHTVEDLADIVADIQLDAAECKDERNCGFIVTADKDYCRRHKDSQPVKQCRKTCGFCGKAPAPSECKDERNCDFIVTADKDYCRRHKDSQPVKQCRKTCGFCGKAPAPSECKDERNCTWIVTESEKLGRKVKDYCKQNAGAKPVKQCPKTCETCGGKAPAPPTDCKDERLDCDLIIDKTKDAAMTLKQYCEKYENDPAVKQCRKTCNMCDRAPSPIVENVKRVAASDCKDERPDCGRLIEITGGGEALEKYCTSWKDDTAVKQCPETCGKCKAPAPSRPECKDERPDCGRLIEITGGGEALEKYCTAWKDDPAVKQCRKTCNTQCPKPPSPPSAEPETVAPETEQPTQKPTKPTAAPKPTQTPGEAPIGFQRDCLAAHNNYRAFHGVPPLKWSADLQRDAQDWANYLADTGKFDHDPTLQSKGQGENLYYTTYPTKLCSVGEKGPDCMTCGDAVDPWYNEEKDYDYGTGKAKTVGALYLHFTQIVWKATKELGMAIAVANNKLVAVARYKPAGNIIGEFQENVLLPDFP